MNRGSFLFLLLMCGIVLIGAYNALFPIPSSTAFVRFFGLCAFMLLCVSLLIGPLALIWPSIFGQIIEPRRAVGIASFVFVLMHFLALASSRYGNDVVSALGASNPLITIPASIILFVLAALSSDWAVRTMGPMLWKNVQRFNYLAFILSFAHFIISANGLFVAVGGKTSINISEAALILLGILTIALQAAGFATRRGKLQAAKNKAAKEDSVPLKQ